MPRVSALKSALGQSLSSSTSNSLMVSPSAQRPCSRQEKALNMLLGFQSSGRLGAQVESEYTSVGLNSRLDEVHMAGMGGIAVVPGSACS